MKNSSFFYSSTSLFLGLIIQILPVNYSLALWRPQFMLMIPIYWLFRSPSQYGQGFALFAGIMLDIFSGEMYGRYALGFSFCIYILIVLSKRLQNFRLAHQIPLLFVVIFLNQLLTVSISLLYRPSWELMALIAPAISSAMIWPVLSVSLDKIFKR